jgi:hypothetical protein
MSSVREKPGWYWTLLRGMAQLLLVYAYHSRVVKALCWPLRSFVADQVKPRGVDWSKMYVESWPASKPIYHFMMLMGAVVIND